MLQLLVSDHRHGWWPAPNPTVTYKWIGKIACDIYRSRTSGAAFYLSSGQAEFSSNHCYSFYIQNCHKELLDLIVGFIFFSALSKSLLPGSARVA